MATYFAVVFLLKKLSTVNGLRFVVNLEDLFRLTLDENCKFLAKITEEPFREQIDIRTRTILLSVKQLLWSWLQAHSSVLLIFHYPWPPLVQGNVGGQGPPSFKEMWGGQVYGWPHRYYYWGGHGPPGPGGICTHGCKPMQPGCAGVPEEAASVHTGQKEATLSTFSSRDQCRKTAL